MRSIAAVVVLAVFVLCAGCSRSSGFSGEEDLFPNTIEARSGETFTITLDSNPSTGYTWRLVGKSDIRFVEEVGSEYIPSENGLVGSPGKEVWTFRAVNKGKTRLELEYVRPWEKDVEGVKKNSFNVLIK